MTATRRGRSPSLGTALLLVALAGACSKDAPPPAGRSTAGGAVPPGGATAPLAPADSSQCPEDGRWRLCSVVDRLEDAGLVPVKQDEPVRRPFFSVPGTAYKVAHGDLAVFVYEDPAALARDVAALDTVRIAPKGATAGDWPVTRPAFIRSANMVAVYSAVSETQIERVQLALAAGPPQPNPDARR
jgi:hypothetical protein